MLRADSDEGFSQLVRRAALQNRAVRVNESRLLQYARLRNAIVHDQVRPGYFIAEPHTDVVETLEQIDATLRNPPRLDAFARRGVVCLEPDDPIARALSLMKEHQLSQFPVLRERRSVGLLSARCIAQWLASALPEAGVLFEEVLVGEVLAHDETNGRNVAFLSRHKSLYDVHELFTDAPDRGIPVLEAVLLTENGDNGEAVVGIVTPWDLLESIEAEN